MILTCPYTLHYNSQPDFCSSSETANTTFHDQSVANPDLRADPAKLDTSSHIAIPYALFGGLYSFMGLVILFFFLIDRSELRQHRSPAAVNESPKSTLRFEWTVMGLLAAYVITDMIVEGTMHNMLVDYFVSYEELGMDKTECSYLLAWFYTTFTAGRTALIFISIRMKSDTILVIFQGITTVGAGVLFLLVFPGIAGRVTAWIAVGTISFGISALYPTGFTWAVRYVHLKYTHVSVVLVASCTGSMLPTYLVAPYLESSSTAVPSLCLGCCALLICILSAMLFTTRNRQPIHEQDERRKLTGSARVARKSNGSVTPEKRIQ